MLQKIVSTLLTLSFVPSTSLPTSPTPTPPPPQPSIPTLRVTIFPACTHLGCRCHRILPYKILLMIFMRSEEVSLSLPYLSFLRSLFLFSLLLSLFITLSYSFFSFVLFITPPPSFLNSKVFLQEATKLLAERSCHHC